MLIVDKQMVCVNASKIDAMTELGILIHAMVNKGTIDESDVKMIVEAVFMDEEELKKKAEEAKARTEKVINDKLKEVLKDMLDELE